MEENVVCVSKKVLEKTKTVEVTGDIIVPDIKPDIINIIGTNGNAYIYKEDVSSGRIRVDGNIDTYVVYLSENGETRSLGATLNFIESIEDSAINENCTVKPSVRIENIETKILNERKITIRAVLTLNITFFEKSEISIFNDFGDIQDAQKLQESICIKSLVGQNQTKASIKEDISVDNSIEVAELIKTEIEISNMENKISYNKVLAKADANVKILFLTEDEKISVVEATIPIMSFIDIDQVNENHTCNTEYTIRNMLFKANSAEMHSITCQVDFDVSCEAFESKTIDVIQDMYGVKNNITFTKKEVEVPLDIESMAQTVKMNERVLVEDVHTIYSVDCRPSILNTTNAGSFTNCEGEVSLDFYYEADNRNGLNVKNVKVPFITKLENSNSNIEVRVIRKSFTVSGENVDCDIELLVSQKNEQTKTINMIENVESTDFEEENDYKMYVYFVKNGDTMWEIAKRFRVCTEDIKKCNNLETDMVTVGDRLYIMR